MAMATITSTSNFSQTISLENNESRNFSKNFAAQDSELGVFSAEKYFNGGMDEPTVLKKYQHSIKKKDEQISIVPIKPRSTQSGTPSIRSESSWTSQSALLRSVRRTYTMRRKTNKSYGKGFLAGLGCKCSCSDKDTVDVEENPDVGEISLKKSSNLSAVQGQTGTKEKSSQNSNKLGIGLNKDNCFTFPNLHSLPGDVPMEVHLQKKEELQPRKSIEVFGSPVQERRIKSLSFSKKLTTLPWNATPGMEEIEFPASSVGDYESDASSDLFEIESLTGKVTPFLARQGSDVTSGCVTPTTGYAPSESSIEWSVVTASAADFSAMSDYEEIRPPPTNIPSPMKTFPATNPKSRTGKDIGKRRPSIFPGCKSQKAVNVAVDAYITNDKAKSDPRMRRVSDSYMPVTRFQAETKLTSFNSVPGLRTIATHHSLPRINKPDYHLFVPSVI